MSDKSEKKYILLHPDPDGDNVYWFGREELNDMKGFMEDYGIKKFLEEVPRISSPSYWKAGEAMLLEVTIKKVVPVTVVEEYEIK